jgi:RNA polymerase sigma factor (TIGR02999 family)
MIDQVRRHTALRRGGGAAPVALNDEIIPAHETNPDLIALHEALQRLEAIDPQKVRVVELRFFGGLTIEETASALSISPATVKREWAFTKAWLFREIAGMEQPLQPQSAHRPKPNGETR